ncbi:MAG: Gfo/Idh/MocA family oxidoreductase [Cytophagales bacterium]|nr:Gfo/Idh/MocA family oxidoreductase [Cytophagales bacterium]
MKDTYNRRGFIKATASAGLGFSIINNNSLWAKDHSSEKKKIGMIGLDTSHCVAFTKEFNASDPDPELGGYRVAAAYPRGSYEIESSYSRIPKYTKEMEELGVEIVDSIPALLDMVDVVLLETNDGRLHLEQAIPVLEAGKTMFIDKPMTASLRDAIIIFEKAKLQNVPVFSSSSLRYVEHAQSVSKGEIGRVVGASTYSPCKLESTHPDLFWYGIHGVELLYTVMGTGCKSVSRIHNGGTDVVVGVWNDDRIGTFRGTRTGKGGYGGTAFGEHGIMALGPYQGYKPLLLEIAKFFQTGISPIKQRETLEILAFMEAADASKKLKGSSVSLDVIWDLSKKEANQYLMKQH